MKWCWVALAALVLAIGIGLWVGSIQNRKFVEKDAERVVEIERHIKETHQLKSTNVQLKKQIQSLQEELATQEAKTKVTRKVWKSRRKTPTSLVECKGTLADASEHISNLEVTLDLERATSDALADVLLNTQGQVNHLEKAWTLERERVRSYQKKQKKNKIKNVVIGVSSAAAGVGVGFMVGALYQ